MERLSQEYMLRLVFNDTLEREELLQKKYNRFQPLFKDPEIKEMIEDFKNTSREHLDLLKDKMVKMNFEKLRYDR